LLISAVLSFSASATAVAATARGHASITFDAARGHHVESGIAKVIALGSTAPDFFEFSNPAAHAQTLDPAVGVNNHLSIDHAQYKDYQRTWFEMSENWHDHYLSAAVDAMNAGHREQAAFLLGYAMHNTEDFATHRGLPNLVHAEADKIFVNGLNPYPPANGLAKGVSPDVDPTRLQSASKLANDDLVEFRLKIGEENWKLFNGEEIKGPGLSATIPEPLTRFGDLGSWDPHSGVIPRASNSVADKTSTDQAIVSAKAAAETAFVSGLVAPSGDENISLLKTAIEAALGGRAQAPDEKLEESVRNKTENFAAWCDREDEMLKILQGAGRPDDTRYPPLQRVDNTEFYLSILDFLFKEPRRYEALSGDEQKMLGETWRDLVEERLADRQKRIDDWRKGMADATKVTLQMLREKKAKYDAALRNIELIKASIRQQDRAAKSQISQIAEIDKTGPPTEDLVAEEEESERNLNALAEMPNLIMMALAPPAGSGGGGTYYYRPSASGSNDVNTDSDGGNIQFNSSTYEDAQSQMQQTGTIHFDSR
jgi:hypothetical protein